jgi:hypothetical protein
MNELIDIDSFGKAPNGNKTALSADDWIYIHCREFINRFGDWEKAWRLEKLKNAEPVRENGRLVVDGEDISDEIKILQEKNCRSTLHLIAKKIGDTIKGSYINNDIHVEINVSDKTAKEIRRHNTFDDFHIIALKYIPDFIKKGIFISEEENYNKTAHSEIKTFQYFVSGLTVADEDFTVKSVVAIQKDGRRYYDQRLSSIEKGLFLDKLSRVNKPGFVEEEALSNAYDKRLIEICQCPQARFLDANFEPRRDVIEKVRAGMTLERLTAQDKYHPDIRMIPRHFDFSRQENNSQHTLPSGSGRSRDE